MFRFPRRLYAFLGLGLIAVILLAVSQSTGSVEAATFTVTNDNDSGAGSLREAIDDANTAGGANTITFAPGTFTINPATALPTITESITIDATGATVIIDGSGAGSGNGLTFNDGTFSLIGGGGLTIQNFDGDGVKIDASGDVTISDSTANDNAEDGFDVNDATGAVTISGSTANGNGDEGFDIDPTSADVSISGSTANGNSSEGFDIDTLGNITVIDSTANNGSAEGFDFESDGDIVVCGVTAIGNADDGIGIEEESIELANASVTNSVVEDNDADGIVFDTRALSASGTFLVNGNNISGHGLVADEDYGLELEGDVTVDATGNWWGDPSGPEHPNNSGGTGDGVGDSLSVIAQTGTVVFDPFLTAPNADAGTCEPTPPPTPTPTPPPTGTPTPTPAVAAATATPTPTPVVLAAALPDTGGTPSDGGFGALPWLAAIAGAIALIGSGSAWLAHRRRRVR